MRLTHPFPSVPKGSFRVRIQPLIAGGKTIEATINPIVVTMDEGCGSIDLISGFEIVSDEIKGAAGWSELDWLIESGQYKVISPAEKTRPTLKANHNNKDITLESTKPK